MHAIPDKDVVLLGIGHTNAHVLRMWRMHRPKNARLTCVSNDAIATYSGMLPGVLAGQYSAARMEIDLVRLTAAAGARLVIDDVTGLDLMRQGLRFAARAPLYFDVLSIGIGSVSAWGEVRFAEASRLVPIKPMRTFLVRLNAHLIEAAAERVGAPLRVMIVGGGAGGVEVALCLPAHLRGLLGAGAIFKVTLVTADDKLLPGSLERTARRVERLFQQRGVQTAMRRRVVEVEERAMTLHDGTRVEADVILWATGAGASAILGGLGLPTDERGFLLTHDTLQTTAGAPIFVVGDSGTIVGAATPKAGVYAVRQGPVLWDNIQRALAGSPLRRYAPQSGFLKLLNTGDGRAIGEWRGTSFEGAWCWRLKDAIDTRFIRKYQDYTPMAMPHEPDAETDRQQMRCAGCGGKVGAGVLARVLERLDIPPSPHVLVGLDRPDDAAVVMPPDGHPTAVTVDFFAAPFDDPYLVGRLAALNAASDLFAVGAVPWAALASVTLPPGKARQQEDLLFQILAGSLAEFRTMGATLVGGHTIEDLQLTVGFTVLGTQGGRPSWTKGGLRSGDRLVLTKPLGTGVLLAAHMQARCRAVWFGPLLTSMLASNGPAAGRLESFDLHAMTDVTGFGLAGHLLGMLRASDMAAEIHMDAVPLLPGAAALFDEGLESTLAPSNRDVEADMESGSSIHTLAGYRALFDPQTGGGLLIGVAPPHADRLLEHLASLGYRQASVIGEVISPGRTRRRLRVV